MLCVDRCQTTAKSGELILLINFESLIDAIDLLIVAAANVEKLARYDCAGKQGIDAQRFCDLGCVNVDDRNFLRFFRAGKIVVTRVEDDELSRKHGESVRQTPDLDLRACRRDAPAIRQLDFSDLARLRLLLRRGNVRKNRIVRSLARELPKLAIEIILIVGIIDATLLCCGRNSKTGK